jgi:predicted PurR-regulated permease PerM
VRDSIEYSIASRKDHSPTTLLLMGVGLIVAVALAWLGRVILMLLFAAIVVAVLMTAVVEWLGVRFKLGRRLSFPLILFVASGLVGLTVWLSGPSIIAQFADLQTDLPQAAHQLIGRFNGYGWGRWLIVQWSGYSQLSGNVSSALTRIGGIVLSTATVLSGLVLVGFLGIYLAAEPEVYFAYVQRVTPPAYRTKLNACAAAAVRNLRWWVLSQMLSMTAVGVIVAVGLWMLGVPLAGMLGMIAALLTFIPNIGPMLSVVPAVLLAVAISPMKGLLTVLLFLAVHFLEGNVITPLLERRIVRLPPALTMTAQLLLAVIAGPLGVALAAPLAAAGLGVFDVLIPIEAVDKVEGHKGGWGAWAAVATFFPQFYWKFVGNPEVCTWP